MDKLGRMQQLFDEVIKDNKKLEDELLLRGLNENDRRTFNDIRRRRIEYIQQRKQNINNRIDK